MTEIKNIKEKQDIADNIKRLVDEINVQIELSNRYFIQVRLIQNTGIAPQNSYLCGFISETITY
jgi:hypothetical protein